MKNKKEQPREKFKRLGADALSKAELLAIIIGSGIRGMNVFELSKLIIEKFGNKLLDITVDDLKIIKGIGDAKAKQIISALTLGKKCNEGKYNTKDFIKGLKNKKSITYEQEALLNDFAQVAESGEYTLFDFFDEETSNNDKTDSIDIRDNNNKYNDKTIDNLLNNVFSGDCLDLMKQIPNKSIDMILCDLPYGTTQNKWDSVIPLNKLWKEYERIIKDNGVIALTSQGIFTAKLILSNEKLFKYKIVWEKSKSTNFLNAKKQPLRKHEDICVFYKKQPTYHPQMRKGEAYNKGIRKNQLTGSYGDFKPVEVKSDGGRYPIDLVYFKTAESEGPVYHPTQKPVALGQYLIKTFTNLGDIVLDNTCGSGSFLISAILEKRNFIGIEKNTDVHLFKNENIDYIYICNKRIASAKKSMDNI